MQDGATLSVVISGATLVGVIGVLARLWISTRAQKLEQPLQVAAQTTSTKLCDERHAKNDHEHENIFARLAALERQSSRVEGEIKQIGENIKEVKASLETLLREARRS